MNGEIAISDQEVSKTKPEDKFPWRNSSFWMKMFIYFWIFSVIGRFYEIIWWKTHVETIVPFAAPYGFGAVAVVLFTWPLIRDFKMNPIIVFVVNMLLTGFVEYVCSAILVMNFGVNHFWDYSNRFVNVNGYVCLESAVLFGMMATFFIYFGYQPCEKYLGHLKKNRIPIIFWVLMISMIADSLHSGFLSRISDYI